MFEGCVEQCLGFIGVQSVDRGCSTADLSDFICEDVLPYQGWAANATLRSTIVRLLLTTKAEEFTFYTERKIDAARATPSGSRGGRGGARRTTAASTTTAPAAATATGSTSSVESAAARWQLTAAEAIAEFDAGRVAWTASPLPSANGSSDQQRGASAHVKALSASSTRKNRNSEPALLFLVPSRELRERAFGFSIRTEMQEMTARFIAENCVQGWESLLHTDDFKARYKSHLVTSGLKWLRRVQKTSLVYLYHKPTHDVVYRYFPHFALPLTAKEMAEEPELMTEGGIAPRTATYHQNVLDETAATTTVKNEGEGSGTPSASFMQRRLCRRWQPLDHYYARKRQDDVTFPQLVFDLQLVRQLVEQSPERRLFLQDAVHAVFAAHNLFTTRWTDLSKTQRMNVRRLFEYAGLRIVKASLTLHGSSRQLHLVFPAEDIAGLSGQVLRSAPPQPSSTASTSHKRPRSGSDSSSEDEGGGGGGDSSHSDADSDVGALPAASREYTLEMGAVHKRRRTLVSQGLAREASCDDEGGDEGEESRLSQHQSHDSSSLAAVRVTTSHRQSEARDVVRINPAQTVEVQAAHEAERRPLALTAFYPRLRFQVTDTVRNKSTTLFINKYVKLRGTLQSQHLLIKYSKQFMVVFARPLSQVGLPSTSPQGGTVKEENIASMVDARETTKEAADSTARASTMPVANIFHFEQNDPRLVKGVSAYALNTALDLLLQATPHHAVSLQRLGKVMDTHTVGRRVLPLLRQLNLVYTTGFTLRGKRRIGMVVLRRTADEPVLDDEAKRAVLDAEAALAEDATSSARPPPLPSGKAIPSALVLEALPAMTAGVAYSPGPGYLRVHQHTVTAVSRIMTVRNGYACNVAQRVSRLHLELWAQHCRYDSEAALEDGVRVRDMFERMSFSTYCVVIGLPQSDLAGVMGSGDGRIGGTGNFAWSTPLKALPPSIYGWCVEQGFRMLCMCLTELQDRQLIRDTDNFQHLLHPELREEVRYALCPSVSTEGYTYTFTSTPVSASSSLYACMRYWLPVWSSVQVHPHGLESALVAAEPNPTLPQIVALYKVLRREVGKMAAQLYQNCGVPRVLGRKHNLGALYSYNKRTAIGRGTRGRTTLATFGARPPTQRSRGNDDTRVDNFDAHQGGAAGLPSSPLGRKRSASASDTGQLFLRKAARTDLSGASVANALESAFHHFAPIKRVEEVVQVVLRSRGKHTFFHLLHCVPPLLPAVLRHGANLTHSLPAISWSGNVYQTEFNSSNTGEGGTAYNRMLTALTVHMGTLVETLRVLRVGQVGSRQHRPQDPSFSSTELLREVVESVYAPQAALPTAASSIPSPATVDAVPSTTAVNPPPPTSSAPASAENTQTSAATIQSQVRATAELEIVTDILRMVLLSDQAHYRASIARSLLSALGSDVLLSRARLLLQRMPSFHRFRHSNFRVPHLELARQPFVLPISALRGGVQPCANVSVLHRWTQAMDDMGQALTSGRARFQMERGHPAMQAFLNLDAHSADVNMFPPSLQLEHQPTMNVASFVLPPNVVRDKLTQLPLPTFTWPAEAIECERECQLTRSSDDARRYGRDGGRGADADSDRARPRRKIARTSVAASSGETPAVRTEADDSDSDDERAVRRIEVEAARQLYPARRVHNAGDPAYLRDLPIDGPPTESELHAVERCRAVLAEGRATTLWVDAAASPCCLPYPSIFHHVDGSFHVYMWQLVVHAVYRFLLRVPGIGHADLEGRLMASGMLSQRAVYAVLQFLLDRHLLSCKEEELSESHSVFGGGVLQTPARAKGPFQRRGVAHDVSGVTVLEGHAAQSTSPLAAALGGDGRLERRCYTAIASLEALQFTLSAATW